VTVVSVIVRRSGGWGEPPAYLDDVSTRPEAYTISKCSTSQVVSRSG
jgi:hypothetical protein